MIPGLLKLQAVCNAENQAEGNSGNALQGIEIFQLAIYLVDEYNKSHHGRLVKRLRRCVLSAESMGSNPIPVTR